MGEIEKRKREKGKKEKMEKDIRERKKWGKS